jgi:hypothetical protein
MINVGVILFLAFASAVVCLGSLAEKAWRISFCSITALLLCICWMLTFSLYDLEHTDTKAFVKIKENIATVEINGKSLNLNENFKRNFTQDEEVIIRQYPSQSHAGLFTNGWSTVVLEDK